LLEKETTGSATHSLALEHNVELIDKLIDIIAAFGDGAKIGHQANIIGLLQHL